MSTDIDVRDRYDIPEGVTLYEDADDLPEGLEDGTPPSYKGSLVHARCPRCGRERSISVFSHNGKGRCNGEHGEDGKPRLVEWELVEA